MTTLSSGSNDSDSTKESVQITGLDNLIRLLTRLETHGSQNASADDIWDDIPNRPVDRNATVHDSEISKLRWSLDEAKLCMATLDNVRDHLGKRMRFLRRACIPIMLGNGIKALPVEILSQIFETGHLSSGGWHFAKCVSHVSQHFRQVSLRTPLLWTRISGYYPRKQVEVFLSRSGQMDLEISTQVPDVGVLEYFLQKVSPHSSRWSSLWLVDQEAEEIMGRHGSTNFPRLRSLRHSCDITLSSWKLPIVSRLQGHIGTFPSGLEFITQITSVELLLRDDVDFNTLTQALYAMKNLTDFCLTLDRCSTVEEYGGVRRDAHSVPIETLKVTIAQGNLEDVVSSAFDVLSCFLASKMDITLENRADDDDPLGFLYHGSGEMFPYGSAINIRILTTGKPDDYNPFEETPLLTDLVSDCKIAHTIHIEAAAVSFFDRRDSIDWKVFTCLRRLRLQHCDQLTEAEVNELVDNLIIRAEPGMGLQSLEIISCKEISEEFLLNLGDAVGSKLTWKL